MEEKNLQVNEERQFHRVRFGAGWFRCWVKVGSFIAGI